MNNDCNVCVFTGRIGEDAETRHRPDGVAVVSFPLAIHRRRKDKATGERKSSTTWVKCVAIGNDGVNMATVAKRGRFVLVRAEYIVRRVPKADGQQFDYYHEHLVESLQLLDPSPTSEPIPPPALRPRADIDN